MSLEEILKVEKICLIELVGRWGVIPTSLAALAGVVYFNLHPFIYFPATFLPLSLHWWGEKKIDEHEEAFRAYISRFKGGRLKRMLKSDAYLVKKYILRRG
jgi:hypothetical protein